MKVARQAKKHGVFLIAALVSLMVSTSLVVAAVRSAVIAQRELRTQHQVLQTEFLTQAALDYAAAKLADSPDYRGEIWEPDALNDKWALAAAEIIVTESANANQSNIRIIARLAATLNQPRSQIERTTEYTFTNLASPNLESPDDAMSK
ncbi:hypothetical protein Q31b_39980 [Novipirellula aureliae]|uniref:Type II secretion system protein K n=1 Tax=Novipirellula aureliae TaxID=2527966 RepID=A0A5C6DQ23_9BACT|nr:hypothetical protein [Novipirellula aureliae]TWU38920.1 hypothetical protein Q31b_39980 [Novipirellula aureliae]